MRKALVCCSGGIDSVTVAFIVKKKLKYKDLGLLFFNYGQRNLVGERKAAKNCATELKAEFKEIHLKELSEISTSLLNKVGKPKGMKQDLKDTRNESEGWYVPCRNLIFLSYALSIAESIEIREKRKSDIFIGFKNEGKEPFPDTTPKFLKAICNVSQISTKEKYKIIAPLIKKDKEEIILLGKGLGIEFAKTFSCYLGPERHCGNCLACRLRKAGFYWANEKDPTDYVNNSGNKRLQ